MIDNIQAVKRILVISASEPLPRLEPQYCAFEDTYPGKLRDDFFVYQFSLGGSSLENIFIQVKTYHVAFRPDYVVLQVGINDAAPRSLKKRELSILKAFSLGRWFLKTVVKKYANKLRKHRKITYTSPEKYGQLIERIKALFPEAKVLGLSILHPFDAHEKKVPGLTENVEKYNEILKSRLGDGYISIKGVPEEGVMPDYIHFNKLGHQYLYDLIIERIETFNKAQH